MHDALRTELRRLDPAREVTLHRRAGDWYAHSGETERAIDHAAAAGDAERTADLLSRHLVTYVGTGRGYLVRGWLDLLGSERIAVHPPLALSAALSSLTAGHLNEARRWSAIVASALERDPARTDRRSLNSGLALVDAMSAHGGIAGMDGLAKAAHHAEPRDSPWRPLCLLLRGVSEHLRGDREGAVRILEEAATAGGEATPTLTSLALAQLAMIAIEQKDWELAADSSDRAITMLEVWTLDREPISSMVFAAAAAARAHHGRVDESKAALRSGIELLTSLGDFIPWYGTETRILLAYASLWLADVVGARALLAEASRLARKTPDAVIFAQWFDEAWAYMDTLAEARMAGPSSLTIAELRILRFLPSHRSFREIGVQLGVSANTVKTQAHSVYRKLGAASRSEAVTKALEAGLLGQ
jgi:LuxR family maltose regulon positive regulatory protein